MAPEWARLPLVVLATMATIIASPGSHLRCVLGDAAGDPAGLPAAHEDPAHQCEGSGQIYVPLVNWALLGLVCCWCSASGIDGKLASAYGIAVTGTMFITTCMLGVLAFSVWHWNRWLGGIDIRLLPRHRQCLSSPPT